MRRLAVVPEFKVSGCCESLVCEDLLENILTALHKRTQHTGSSSLLQDRVFRVLAVALAFRFEMRVFAFGSCIRVHILNMGLVENTLTGNLILTVMLAFAEYERGMIVERTQTGKAVARQDPNFKDGRPKKFTAEQIELALSLLEQGKTYRQITTMTGISKSTLIRARKQRA